MNCSPPFLAIILALATITSQQLDAQQVLPSAEREKPVSQSAASVATSNDMRVLDDTRKLIVGDVLSFRIVEDGDPIKRIVVTDSGEVEIPYIGRVSAKDRSCAAVAKQAKKLLEKDYYYKATVLLGLDYNTYGSRTARAGARGGKVHAVNAKTGYTIMGEIGSPGVFALPSDEAFTISHAILRSGGFQKFANEKRVRLLRKQDGKRDPKTYVINVHNIMSRGELQHDAALRPGDVIIVDRKLINF